MLRWGAIGDCIQATVLFKPLKKEGYRVTFSTNHKGVAVTENNPYVDAYEIHESRTIQTPVLLEMWAKMAERFDRFINLSGSIEVNLLPTIKEDIYRLPTAQRHAICNRNYFDETLKWGGFDIQGRNPEIYVSESEDKICKSFMKKHFAKDDFVVLWCLSGSSTHKAYPWTELVAKKLQELLPKIKFITIGEAACVLTEWEDKNTINMVGKWPIRRSIIMPKFVDLVIGPETGILSAAAAFDTPKIVMLSHSSPENLTKYWKNAVALHADPEAAPCWPCHKLTYVKEECEYIAQMSQTAACIANVRPVDIIRAVETFYRRK